MAPRDPTPPSTLEVEGPEIEILKWQQTQACEAALWSGGVAVQLRAPSAPGAAAAESGRPRPPEPGPMAAEDLQALGGVGG